MKKLVKLLFGGVLVLVLLVAVGAFLAFRSIDSIAKHLIERGGTHALGAETTVESADVGVFDGTFKMTGLNVANPEGGYTSPHFMNLPNAGVAVSLGTLLEDTIRLPQLTIGKADMYLDGAGGKANYKRILENIKKLESKGGDKKPSGGSDKPGKTFVIDRLTIEGATVHVAGFPGIAAAVGDTKVTVPTIELDNVGSKEPLTTAELVSLIVKTVLQTSVEMGGGIIPADIVGDLKGQLAQLESLQDLGIDRIADVGGIGEDIKKTADDAKKKVEDAAKDIEKGIGDMFNK